MSTNTKTDQLADQLLSARKKSVAEFGEIAHRLELVTEFEGVDFINDSKATDLGTTEYSLEFLTSPVVWIVGESEFEEDYAELQKLVTYKVKGIVTFGENTRRIGTALSDFVDFYLEASTVEEATKISQVMAKSGDTVLFSPACSSYAYYNDFKERGQHFRDIVNGFDKPGGRLDGSLFG